MADEPPDSLPAGYRIGTYVIESELPPARMGRVYRAVQTSWNEVVAINVLSPALKRTRDGTALFFDRIRKAYENHRGDDRNPILDMCELAGAHA